MKTRILITTVVAFVVGACAPETETPAFEAQEQQPELEGPDQPTERLPDPGPDEHVIYRTEDVEWQPAPASLEPGAEIAVLEGDPAEAGVFTMRLRMPDGFTIAPHWHPNVERVTVLSGTFNIGSGDVLDPAVLEPLEPGTYTAIPPETTHFAMAEGETVIQITTVGPWELNYVNPQDDPRRRN